MIVNDLCELLLWSADYYKDHPRKDIFLIEPKGVQEDELNKMRRIMPKLPSSYLQVVSEIDVVGKRIGNFGLSPFKFSGAKKDSLSDRVIAINSADKNPLFNSLIERGLIEVASIYGGPLAVREKDRSDGGKVYYLHPPVPGEVKISPIAKNFEHLLILGVEFYEHCRSYDEFDENAWPHFKVLLEQSGCDPDFFDAWKLLTSISI